jgi:Na+-driven multidrug efflux pump
MSKELKEYMLSDLDEEGKPRQSNSWDEEDLIQSKEEIDQKTILKQIVSGGFKLAISNFLNVSTRNLLLYFLQFNGDEAVQAAVTLGNSILVMLSLAIISSINSGLMNRFAHTYGMKDYRLMGLYLHRAIIINLFLFIVCCFLVSQAPKLFERMGYEPAL